MRRIAAICGFAAVKEDLLTLVLSLVIVWTVLDISLISVLPEDSFRWPLFTVLAILVLIWAAGSILVFSKNSARDYEDHVPEYVSRIAEKERFLKELEIARTVQLRFLPESNPDFF